jgi:methionine synthase I (cobalamin-dependent)
MVPCAGVFSFEQALNQRVLMLNASAANPAWSKLPDADWGGTRFRGSPNLNVTCTELVLEWNIELRNAGTDVLETRSCGADPFTAEEYGADRSVRNRWNRVAVSIARQAASEQNFIIGAVGQSPDLLSCQHRHSFEEHVVAFAEQIRDLWIAGIDAIHLAFYLDSRNLEAALHGVTAVEQELGCRIPTMITFDLNFDGTILSGERPEALSGMLRSYKPIALGLATYGYGQDTVRRLREITDVPIGLVLDPCPYAPPSMTENRPIDWLAECLGPLLDEGLLSFCGISCTVPSIEYIKTVSGLIRSPGRGLEPSS